MPVLYPEISSDPTLHTVVAGIFVGICIGVVGKGIASIVNGHKDVRENTPKEQTLIERLERINQSELDNIRNYNLSV